MNEKRVFVTGASRGIGRATALRLAKSGWKVAVHFVRDEDSAKSLMEALGDSGAGCYQCDMNNPSEMKALFARVTNDAPVHALVNNAGIYRQLDFASSSDTEFDATLNQIMAVNFESPARLIRLASQHFLVNGGGKVVNVCSRVAHRGEAKAAFYSASKAALLNLTRALSVEHAKAGIQHFAIAPGWVNTAMARDGMDDRLPEILEGIPLGRMASPEDCAGAIQYLLSDEAVYLSGIVIDINGASYLR